jgi:hypothetical protein
MKVLKVSGTKARDVIHRARYLGFLEPASQRGQGGGLMTEMALKLLDLKEPKGGRRHAKR